MADKVTGDRGVPEAKVEGEEPDVFAEAFDTAEGEGDRPELSPGDDPKNVKEGEAPEPPKEKAADPPVETPADPPVVKEDEETPEKLKAKYSTLQGILKHEKETWETEKVQFQKDIEAAKAVKTPAETPASASKLSEKFVDSLTDEQKKELEEYEKDFDVVSKMEGIKRKRALAELKEEIETWKADVLGKLETHSATVSSAIAPVVKQVEEHEQESHFNLIRTGYTAEDGTPVPGHSDFEKYRDDGSVIAWIEKQPSYIRVAAKAAYEKGSARDVIELYNDFKRDNNIPLTPQATDNVTDINLVREQKKQALTAVHSRRGSVNAGIAKVDDYEGAFDEALNK